MSWVMDGMRELDHKNRKQEIFIVAIVKFIVKQVFVLFIRTSFTLYAGYWVGTKFPDPCAE